MYTLFAVKLRHFVLQCTINLLIDTHAFGLKYKMRTFLNNTKLSTTLINLEGSLHLPINILTLKNTNHKHNTKSFISRKKP